VQRLAQVLAVAPETFVHDDLIGGLSMLTVREAAVLLDVPYKRLRKWMKAGVLPGYTVAGRWRIPAVAVAELERSGRLRGRSRRLDPRYRGTSA
jgi:excisionase family DNA binding protein